MTVQDWKKVRVKDHNRREKQEPPGRLTEVAGKMNNLEHRSCSGIKESSTDSMFISGYLYICYNQNGNQETRLVLWDSRGMRRGWAERGEERTCVFHM